MIANIRSSHNARKQKSKIAKENKLLLDKLDQLEDLPKQLEKMLKDNPLPKINIPKLKLKKGKKNLGVEAVVTDIHVGLKTDSYSTKKCEKSIQKYTQVMLDEIERLEKNFNVTHIQANFLGDIMQGNKLHGADSQASCELTDAEQVVEAIRILFYNFIIPIAKTGKKVQIIGICGNHDRQEQARPIVNAGKTYLTWIIYNTMKMMCELTSLKNVTWDIPNKEYTYFDMFGSKVVVEHGHASGIKSTVQSLENQLLKRANQLGIIAQGIRVGHFHGSLNSNRGRHIIAPSSVSGDCFGDHLGYVSYPALLLNYYVETKSRDFSYYHSFEVDLSDI